jgi:DNA methylase
VDEPRVYPVPVASDEEIAAFITRYGTPYDPETDDYHREPFVADIREGKNDPIYNAHSYHTKVPPRAIIPYILHYTEPGDIILDPFCGSGMTGVAAMICASPSKDLLQDQPGTKLGGRRVILNDLSPAACHIAFNYCRGSELSTATSQFDRIVTAAENDCKGIYDTFHIEPARGAYDPAKPEVSLRLRNSSGHLLLEGLEPISTCQCNWELVERADTQALLGSGVFSKIPLSTDVSCFIRIPASIVYTVWSDVYKCEGMVTVEEHGTKSSKTGKPSTKKSRRPRGCGEEIVLWEVAVDLDVGKVHESFCCPNCGQSWDKAQIKQ